MGTLATYLGAFWANQCAAILALEKVHNHTVIPLLVSVPEGFCQFHHLLISSTLIGPVGILDVRFLQNAIQIFVKTVKQESKKFLRVVLGVTREGRCVAGYFDFEVSRCNAVWSRVGVVKEVSKEVTVGASKVAFGAQGIVRIELRDIDSSCKKKNRSISASRQTHVPNSQRKYSVSSGK